MTRVVHKYAMPEPGWTLHYDVPTIHRPLSVQMQDGKIMLWCEVTLFGEETTETRFDFWTVPTGRPVPPTSYWIGTVQDGPYVWHVYGRAQK